MTCDDVELTLALASMGDVEAETLRDARLHARECERCHDAERDYTRVLDMVARAAVPEGPPAQLRRRVLDAVRADDSAPVPSRRWWVRWWERVPAGRPLTVLGFAGSVAAVALAVVLAVGSRTSPVVTEPLQAGVNQPGVSGTLMYVRSSGDAVVSVRGLRDGATTPSGGAAVYELWLMRGDGRVAPAGLLSRQADGTWRAVVHRQASADVAVAATLEPAPGTQSPTGAEVFQSNLP